MFQSDFNKKKSKTEKQKHKLNLSNKVSLPVYFFSFAMMNAGTGLK